MKIYFDMNIYNRVFDNQTQIRIRFKSIAIDTLFKLIEKKKYELVWSFILEYENSRNSFMNRKPNIKYGYIHGEDRFFYISPLKTLNKNAHIGSFHGLLEEETNFIECINGIQWPLEFRNMPTIKIDNYGMPKNYRLNGK